MVNGKFQFLYTTEFWCRMSKHGADKFMCKDMNANKWGYKYFEHI